MNAQLTASKLEWVANMKPMRKANNHRRTSIICTIGPKTNSVPMLQELRKAGMNIVRLNFSHGSYEYHGSVIKNTRDSFKSMPGKPVAIALDTKGPEIRTGDIVNGGEACIEAGSEITLTNDPAFQNKCTSTLLFVDYPSLTKSLSAGKKIFIEDGNLTLEVVKIIDTSKLIAKALNTHTLTSRKNVNLPGTDVDLPAVSEKDKQDLKFAVEQGLDMVFASFIRRPEDVRAIRDVLGPAGKRIMIISKIENLQGVENFDQILEETDGVMVARGDLGMEIPLEKVFIAQKMMITKCNLVGKPVICATQMLESMTNNPRPTRAEVSDVSNAVLDGADCVMLSGETAKGNYPIEAVQMMHNLCLEAETVICYPPLTQEIRSLVKKPFGKTETVASSAVAAAQDHDVGAIIVLTTSGNTARLVSKYRPHVPIIAITRDEIVARQMHLYRGVYPLQYQKNHSTTPTEDSKQWQDDVDQRITWAVQFAVANDLIPAKCNILAIQGWRGGSGKTNTMRILDSETLA